MIARIISYYFSLSLRSLVLGAEFFAQIKKAVGSDVPDEEFVIPRAAYDALVAEYDAVCAEVANFKVSAWLRIFFFLNLSATL